MISIFYFSTILDKYIITITIAIISCLPPQLADLFSHLPVTQAFMFHSMENDTLKKGFSPPRGNTLSTLKWGLCEYVIVHTIWGGSPVILWISLGGKPKWLPLKFGYYDVMRTRPIMLSLERIQASVARRLLRADWFTPKETLLEQLGWPALRWRREISSLTLFHKLLHSRPEPLRELLFPFAHTTSSRCRRKPLQLLLPQARTTRYRDSFFYRSALLWNSLPQDIQAHTNSTAFRKAIEQHWSAYRYTTKQNIPIPLSSALS